jgi:hypothetical protein
MNKPMFASVALASAAVLFGAGCGGNDDSASSEPAPTKSAYITEGDAICSADQVKFEAIVKDLPNDVEAPESQKAITDEIVPLLRNQVEQLRDLTPPEGDEAATAEIYDEVDQALNKVEQDPSALDSASTFEKANNLATDYGFEVCGN